MIVWMIGAGLSPVQAELSATNLPTAKTSIPFAPTRHDTVRDLLWLADVGTNDVVYDLGAGDGRVAIAAVRDFGARKAVGVEINPQLVEESRQNAAKAGVANRVEFLHGDLFTNDFSAASVVVLYLGHTPNLDLRAELVCQLKPGARVVSHQFGMGEWPADKTLDVRTALLGMYSEMLNSLSGNPAVPDFSTPFVHRNHDILSAWVIPAPVAGVWRGKVGVDAGDAELKVTLSQSLSGLTGSFELQGTTKLAGNVQADLWGNHVRLNCVPTNRPYGAFLALFDGHASGDAVKGRLWISRQQETSECEWIARRENTDFSGTWEWSGPKDSPVRLKLERRDGRLAATYADRNRDIPQYSSENQPIPVKDIYDFGGGFYFSLLLGREGGGRRMGPDDGWVIGEGVMVNGALRGNIAFYPYPEVPILGPGVAGRGIARAPKPGTGTPQRTGKRDWQPARVTP